MRALLCSFLLAVFALAAADTNITGKWSGNINATTPGGETKNETAFLVLNQAGSDITGTVGPDEEHQLPILKGKIEGDKITIEADSDGRMLKFELVLAGDHIKGDMNIEMEGQARTAKLDVTRVK
jgi:hypothetical protein